MPMRDNGYRAGGEAAAIFALALSTRWLYVHQTGDHPLRDIPIGATIAHVERAAGEAAGFASLYDAFLAGTLGMAGGDYQLVRGVQVALGAVNCVLVWSLARAAFSPGVAVAAGLAAALYGPAIYFAGELLPSVLATCLVLLSLIALSRALTATGTSLFCLSGLLLGLAVLAEWWVSLFALVILVWLLHRKNQGAAGWLALGLSALLLPALLWSAWTPGFAELGLAEGFRRVYALWQGIEFLPDLDPYYARQHSSLLAALLWEAGLAFPFGLVAPLALVGILSRLRVERQPMETALLLFAGCFAVQALLFSPADSTARSPATPALLIFAAAGVAAMSALPRRPALAVGVAGLLLAVGLNTGDVRAAGRGRQHYWLGYGFEQLGLRANAVREYELALALDAGSIETYYALAKHYLAQSDNIRAGGLYERLLQRWPDQDRARRALGEVYMASGRAPEAAKLYRALIDAEADSAADLPMLGEALVRSGDMEGGIRAYREALNVLPSNGEARGKLALLYSAIGQLAEAEDAYRILFEEGQVAEFGPPLAEVLIRSQRDEEATAVLERVLQVAPESTAALALRGKQLFGQGRHRAAAIYFERLRRLWPQDYRVYFFLAKLYEHLGEETKADDAHALYIRYRRHQEREEMQEHMQLVGETMAEQLKSHLEQR